MSRSPLFLVLCGVWLGVGCRDDAPSPPLASGGAPAAAEASGQAALDLAARTREAVDQALNPKHLPVYAGPTGSVKGIVKVSGDPPPLVPEMVAKLPAGACPRAHDLQRKVFRQGVGDTLADALVTVTEYPGFIAPKSEAVRVELKGCAFDARVLAMTFGQHFDVFNLDAQSYMPRLVGTPSYALRVAMPGGSAVPIFAPRPGQYMLIDQTRDYIRADVYVLSYPTFDVTGLDGQFEISGIPVGDVKVSAYAPAIAKLSEQRVTIEAGVTKELAFELVFSAAEFRERLASSPEPVTK